MTARSALGWNGAIVVTALFLGGCQRESHSVEQFGKDDALRAHVIADCRSGKNDYQPAECTRAQDADRLNARLKSLGQ